MAAEPKLSPPRPAVEKRAQRGERKVAVAFLPRLHRRELSNSRHCCVSDLVRIARGIVAGQLARWGWREK